MEIIIAFFILKIKCFCVKIMFMNKGFVKDINLLKEQATDTDFLDISQSVDELSEKLSSIDDNAMLGVVGAFGVGKSTLIENVKAKRKSNEGETWIHFDAWQFPERKELWDGLILETAKQVGKLEIIKRSLDGEEKKDKKLAVSTVTKSVGVIANIATAGISSLFQSAVGLVGDTLHYFLESTPAKRVFEMQEVFVELLKKIDAKKVVFVLEDVDRSGQDGLFFLETFRQFLSNNKLEKSIVVITPISNESYFAYLDTYLKCLDFVEFYNKGNKSLEMFVSQVFIGDDIYDAEKLSDLLSYVYQKYQHMTIRKIKLVLRQANINYIELTRLGYEPNKLICIAVQMSKYIVADEQNKISCFEHYLKNRTIGLGNEINRLIFITSKSIGLYQNERLLTHEKTMGRASDIKLVTRDRPDNVKGYPSSPYIAYTHHSKSDSLCLPDFYFRDL